MLNRPSNKDLASLIGGKVVPDFYTKPVLFLLTLLYASLIAFPGLSTKVSHGEEFFFFKVSPIEDKFCLTSFDPFEEPNQGLTKQLGAVSEAVSSAVSPSAVSSSADDTVLMASDPGDQNPDGFTSPILANIRDEEVEVLYHDNNFHADNSKQGKSEFRLSSRSPESTHVASMHAPDNFDLLFASDGLGSSSKNREVDPFQIKIEIKERPSYLPSLENVPIIDDRPRPLSAKNQAIVRLVKKEMYKRIRRRIKRNWKDKYKEDFSMTHAFYQSRLTQINQIGKGSRDFDPFNTDQDYNETRDSALSRKNQEGEKEIKFLEWGLLEVNDRGSISFNLRSLIDLDAKNSNEFLQGPKIANDHDIAGNEIDRNHYNSKPLISGRYYSVKTRFRANFNPFRGLDHSDFQETITTYGGSVEVDFLSDILQRKLFTAELEGELKRDGRWGVFFNIVLKGRR